MNTPTDTEATAPVESPATPCSSWAYRRGVTLGAALVLIFGGALLACFSPDGFIEAHLIERRIMLGGATMVGGFLLLAVHVLTGILAVQPPPQDIES